MKARFQDLLPGEQHTWLVTGVAGFIGSNLLEALLEAGQHVVGLDNFATGHERNLTDVAASVGPEAWERFRLVRGDVADLEVCRRAVQGADYVLHQAALGSVPLSLEQPLLTHQSNVTGFLNVLQAARECGVRRVVYAASSATYGDHQELPLVEERIGNQLSPYALSKYANELYADVFARCYDLSSVGLRYFNVFGKRQDPEGAYAAVIPQWIAALLRGAPVYVNGDGENTRDFCFVDNVVQANLRAALADGLRGHRVYNVAVGARLSLNQLFAFLRDSLARRRPALAEVRPVYREFRAGDVRHSQASIDRARQELGYEPSHGVAEGLEVAMDWYIAHLAGQAS
jgi:UDP-N-acetylglucosamine 4-epimerase